MKIRISLWLEIERGETFFAIFAFPSICTIAHIGSKGVYAGSIILTWKEITLQTI
jgi:hypothetical protein